MSIRDYIQIETVDFSENFLNEIISVYEKSLKPIVFQNDPINAVVKNISIVNVSANVNSDKAKQLDNIIFANVSTLVNEYHKKWPFMKFKKDQGYYLIKIESGGYHRLHIDNEKGITVIIKLSKSYDGQLVLLDGAFNPKMFRNQACVFPSNFMFPWSFDDVKGTEPVYYLYTVLNE